MSGNVEMIDLVNRERPIRTLPRAGPSTKARKRKPPPLIDEHDVISITSSEDEAGPSQPKKPIGLATSFSGVWEVEPPPSTSSSLFLPDPDEPIAGPSRSQKRSQPAPPPPSQTPSRVLEEESTQPVLIPPAEDPDPLSAFVAQVLEIIPDVDPSHALALVTLHYDEYKDKVVEPVLHTLFEASDYPKADKKGKRRREEVDDQEAPASVARRKVSEVDVDYASEARPQPPGLFYQELSIVSLRLYIESLLIIDLWINSVTPLSRLSVNASTTYSP